MSLVCDFCKEDDTEENPLWVIPAKSFKMATVVNLENQRAVPLGSADDWMACDTCADLVEARNLEKLVYRAIRAIKARIPKGTPKEAIDRLEASLHDIYRMIFASIGGARRRPTEQEKARWTSWASASREELKEAAAWQAGHTDERPGSVAREAAALRDQPPGNLS